MPSLWGAHRHRPPSARRRRRAVWWARPLVVLFVVLGLLVGAASAEATTYTVTSSSDSGAGSLRAVLTQAETGTNNEVNFASGVTAISLASAITVDNTASISLETGGETVTIGPTSSYYEGGDLLDVEGPGSFSVSGVAFVTNPIEDGDTSLTLDDDIFADTHGSDGGALELSGNASATIEGTSFQDTTASGDGGAIVQDGLGLLKISDSTFTSNTASDGGAIEQDEGSTEISDSSFTDDTATTDGGVIDATDGPVSITDSTLADNSGDDDGGALTNVGSSEWVLDGDTIDGNTAGAAGVGIEGAATVQLKDTIVSQNTPANCDGAARAGSTGDLQYGDATCGAIAVANPLLGPLETVPSSGGVMAQELLLGSPAIDAVPPADCTAEDQNGLPRPATDQTDCDAGAFEDFKPVVDAPTASGVTSTTASLTTGMGTPTNVAMFETVDACTIEYGTTTAYGMSVPCSAGSLPTVDGSASLSGLTPNMTYHVRADVTTAWDGGGTVDGPDGTFTTLPAPPTASAPTASGITDTGATLGATLNPENETVTACSFGYGTTAALGTTVPCSPTPTGAADQAVSTALTGLNPDTTYSFDVTLTTSQGTATTSTATFTTAAVPTSPTTPTTPTTPSTPATPTIPTKPTNITPPSVSGTPAAGHTLSCSPGTWTGAPTFTYIWQRGGTPLQGATGDTYTVVTLDEGSTLTCVVTATTSAGNAQSTSAGRLVPVPAVAGCPKATGTITGRTLGLVHLGMSRAEARHVYTKSSDRGRTNEDFFCLTPIGVRVGYASARALTPLPPAQRKRLIGHVIWASTSNPVYSLGGIRPGATLAAAEHALRHGGLFVVGRNHWYLAPHGSVTAILKVRENVVQEIGVANSALTRSRAADRLFLRSFD